MADSEPGPWSVEVTGDPSAGRRLVALQVGQFALAGLIALAIVGVATSVASRRVGEREAIGEARTTTVIRAQGVVTPVLTDALVAGDRAAVAELDQVVRRDVLDDSLVRVKLWTGDGRIVYSDEPALVNTEWPFAADKTKAMETGRIEAEVSDLEEPENRFERSYGKLLEVYLPVRTPSGQVLLFEAYYRYGLVVSNGSRLWRSFAPITLGALVMLEVVQLPLAWSLARRLRQRLRERGRCCSGPWRHRTWSAARSPATCMTASCRTWPASPSPCRRPPGARRILRPTAGSLPSRPSPCGAASVPCGRCSSTSTHPILAR